jgi:hypothetical protein
MPGNSRAIVRDAEHDYPARVRLAVPGSGLGRALEGMHAWLDENCGADGWTTAPAGAHGVLNDAVAFYFRNATLAAAFVTRWCAGGNADVENGAFKMREDAPKRRSELRGYGWNGTGQDRDH